MMDTRFSAAELERFGAAIFRASGVSDDHAVITARRLVEADLRGRTGHGLIRVGPYVERLLAGGVNLRPDIRVCHETAVSAQIDADNGLGQVAMTRAAELAIAKAESAGVAWVGTVRSNHAGAAGIYPAMAARRGLIGIYCAVANANGMPAWGGVERLLGTNPLAIAIPAGDRPPFVLDIATTVASHGTIKVAALAGEPLPDGWVVGPDGQWITDPARVDEGYLMPIGGYKGAGLNIAIGLLAGVLNGAAFGGDVIDHRVDLATPTDTGQSMLVLRPDLFMPAADFAASMTRHLDELRGSGPDGASLRLPGDRAAALEDEQGRLGIAVPESLRIELNDTASMLGLTDRLDAAHPVAASEPIE
jgi:LDH2 family malate/lactate/ureidoglycolate dehydrogenase